MKRNKIKVLLAEVAKNEKVAKDIWQLTLDPGPDSIVTEMSPGQFVCLAPLSSDSVMARPLSVSMISTSNGTFKILHKVVGKNTLLMSQLPKGQKVKFWGPLGKSEIINPDHYEEVWLIGGGIGIAPLLFFERVLSDFQGATARVFYGNRIKDEIIKLNLYTHKKVEIATEDGSVGYKGLITDLFAKKVKYRSKEKRLVITCGPDRMMQKVAEICQQAKLDCYVILEKVMACGMGVCLGCSIKTTSGMKKICHDGPIFKAEEVIWDELA